MRRLADPGASWAVIAGVSRYDNLEDLPAVSNNVAAVKAALTHPAVWGLPPERIDVVEPNRVRDDFIAKAGTAAKEKATDTLVVYYAGHGLADSQSDELYLALPGTEQGEVDTALRYEYLNRRITRPSNAVRHVVVILDCCYSGRAARLGRMSAGEDLAALAALPGHCVLTASAPTKAAQAPPGAPYTAFTRVLLDLLHNGVPGGGELLTVQALHRHARVRLKQQAPDLGTSGVIDVVSFARNTAHTTVPEEDQPMPATMPAPVAESALPPGMPTLVRVRLENMPLLPRFELIRAGQPETKQVAKARTSHALADDEELIAVWPWKRRILAPPYSLAFTSLGIRISTDTSSLFVRYEDFHSYTFTYGHREAKRSEGPYGPDRMVDEYNAQVKGADVQWEGPYGFSPEGIIGLVDALKDIQRLAAGGAPDRTVERR